MRPAESVLRKRPCISVKSRPSYSARIISCENFNLLVKVYLYMYRWITTTMLPARLFFDCVSALSCKWGRVVQQEIKNQLGLLCKCMRLFSVFCSSSLIVLWVGYFHAEYSRGSVIAVACIFRSINFPLSI